MILATIELFCRTIRCALLPQTLDRHENVWNNQTAPNLCNWLAHCLRDVRGTYSSIMRLDLPSEVLDIIKNLIQDLKLHCMIGLLKQAVDFVKTFSQKETWKIEFDSQHGGITELVHKISFLLFCTFISRFYFIFS